MSTQSKPNPGVRSEDERLLHALVSRGLLTVEDARLCRQCVRDESTQELLTWLVKQGLLTIHQARRTLANFEAYSHQQIPGYQLLEKLGQGSMGTVYKARQLSMDRLVAIKILLPKLAADPGYLNRFLREARLAARLSSNNVVQAIDAGSLGSCHYFIMEFVEGRTIKEDIEKGKIFEEREAIECTLQVAQALDHAHRRQMVHRDVKPANIVVTTDGIVKLADLGLARFVQDRELDEAEKGLTIGTPYYIAPELIRARAEPDIRCDIYSLGGTLYHMVTGRPPFPGKKVPEVLKGHLYTPLTPPDQVNDRLSSGISEVIEYMMTKNREERYSTPAGLVLDLECLLRGEPPKLARQRDRSEKLAELAHGEVIDSDHSKQPQVQHRWTFYLAVMALLLGASLFGNLLQFVLRW